MASTKCFVFGCKTGCDSDKNKPKAQGIGKLGLFVPPRDEDKFQKWRRAIPRRADKELSRKDRICELHFLPQEISRYYVHKMPDGIEVHIERGKIKLANDAVPSIFPVYHSYQLKNIEERKPPTARKSLPKRPKIKNIPVKSTNNVDQTMSDFLISDASISDHTMSDLPLSVLIENLHNVRKPNKFWGVSSHEDFIVCVKWDKNYVRERQIVIEADLGIKIMHYGKQVSTNLSLTVNTVDKLSQLIMKVDNYPLCSGAMNGNKGCSVFMERNWGASGRREKWCAACRENFVRPHFKWKLSALSA